MTENISIELIGIVALVITQIGQTLARVFTVSKKDKKQDTEILATQKDVKDIKSKLEIEGKALRYIYEKTRENEYREQLKVKLRQRIDKIIFANSLGNTDFIAFVNQTRDTYINFIDSIIVQDISTLRIDTIKSDMITFAKNLKNISNFDKMCKIDDFYNKLKVKVIKPQIEIFLMRFKEEIFSRKKKYNGDFDKIAVGTAELLIVEIIKTYRDCNE